ncbi:ABC transporter ATP-binding protein [Leptothoe sp. ISB3NOV94-8A]
MQRWLPTILPQGIYLIIAIKIIWQSAPQWTCVSSLLLVLQGLLPATFFYVSKVIVDNIGAIFSTAHALPNSWHSYTHLMPWLLVLGGIAIVDIVLTSTTDLVNTAQGEKVTNSLQDILHAKSIAVDLAYYENPQYYDVLQRAQNEASFRCNQILSSLANVFKNAVLLAALSGLLLSISWQIIALLVAASLPVLWVRLKYTRVFYRWQRRRTALQRQSFYMSHLLTEAKFAKEIRLFNLGSFLRRRYRTVQTKIYREKLAIATKQAVYNFSTQLFGGVLLLVSYGYIIYRAFNNEFTFGDLVLYYQAMQRGQTALKQFFNSLAQLHENNLFLKNIFEFLELTPHVLEPEQPQVIPTTFQEGIVFEQVNFKYPNTQRQVLHNINLRVAPGETIALVGENGCGKTTLIKLLCRLYDPTSGDIYLESKNIKHYAISELRRQISVIFQDYARYYLTARENISFGNIEHHHDVTRIEAAARQSGAESIIQTLPKGYETILGKLFDQGEELSIGQWQKIALARAFLRDSQIMVLDEPTAAMDPKAEYAVFQKLKSLARHQAIVLISHRMSTVRLADRIYVMEQGKIVECGSHAELMNNQGLYFQLFEIQAEKYR